MKPVNGKLGNSITELLNKTDNIETERKELLESMSEYISEKLHSGKPVNLNFICTHNSRRSHLAQIWAVTAADRYGVENVSCYSGGTEVTAFNINAVNALKEQGFDIRIGKQGDNPVYHVKYDTEYPPVESFSKLHDDPVNPSGNFAAVMTCSQADETCPFIPGAEKRFALYYEDPKVSDGTPEQEKVYLKRANEIAAQMLYLFGKVKEKL